MTCTRTNLAMSLFAFVILTYLIVVLNLTRPAHLLVSTEYALDMMNKSLQFVQHKQSEQAFPVLYSSEVKGFYEWTDWKQLMDSSYGTFREGDLGVYTYYTNTRFINSLNGFNTILNQRIPLDRIVPDKRPSACQNWHYLPQALPTVSVIIPFRNEDTSLLLRTIYSILMQTPKNLLAEIILIDDHSDLSHKIKTTITSEALASANKILLDRFENYSHHMPLLFGQEFDANKIQMLVSEKRLSLAKSLNYGISKSTGQVLVFLKSHIEVSHNWLPPLLAPILDDWHTVSVPSIVRVAPDSFKFDSFEKNTLDLMFWNWGLFTKAVTVTLDHLDASEPGYVETLPYQQDVLSSHQFAISRDLMSKIGLFDSNYLILDDVNWDLSLKILNLDGKVVKTPCSIIFALDKKIPDPMMQLFDDIYLENNFKFEPRCFLKTIARKWMHSDDTSHFFTFNPSLLTEEPCLNASNNYEVSHKGPSQFYINGLTNSTLDNFQYSIGSGNHLDFIRSNSFVAAAPEPNLFSGSIMNPFYSICLHIDTSSRNEKLMLDNAYCRTKPTVSPFRLDRLGFLRIDLYCLTSSKKVDNYFLVESRECFFNNEADNLTKWSFTREGQIVFQEELCLTYGDALGTVLAPCLRASNNPSQVWQWAI